MTRDEHQQKVALMAWAYPSLKLVSPDETTPPVWEGWLQPLHDRDHLDGLLEDLDNDRQVKIDRERRVVVHDPDCRRDHHEHRLAASIRIPATLFKIRIEDHCDGRLPTARVLEPFIPKDERRHHLKDDGICSFAPWEHPWFPETSSIVTDFTDHVLIWLLKQDIYSKMKSWLGSETPHDAHYLLSTIKPHEHCCCGSAKSFGNCCRFAVAYSIFGKQWFHLELWLRRHDMDLRRFEPLVIRMQNLRPGRRAKSVGTS